MTDAVLWSRARFEAPPFSPLAGDAEVDVAVVGAGLVGLAAAELVSEGLRVAVLEGGSIGMQATGRSTAKATSQHGPIYRALASDIGEEAARAYARANEEAIGWIAGIARGEAEAFARAPAVAYARSDREAEELREEAEVAARLGLPASFRAEADLPVENRGALVFAEQGAINPYLLLRRLAERLRGRAAIHERTRAISVEHGEPCRVETERGTVRARWVIVATQMPVIPEGKFFAKAFPHAHPVVAARLNGRALPPDMVISAGPPTRSYRPARVAGEDWIVATGEPYRPGESDAQDKAFAAVESFLQERFGVAPELRWTNEDFKPMDGLPFVGAASGSTSNLLVATGFDAWGITTGVVAAHILADTINGKEHPLAPVLDAARIRPLKGATTFFSENAKAGYQMMRDRAFGARVENLDAIARGGGGIVRHNGQQVAASRDEAGRVTAVSAICTHLGCVVGWNPVDRTWDCPCHGSRFTAAGAPLYGPATTPLEPVDLAAPAEEA